MVRPTVLGGDRPVVSSASSAWRQSSARGDARPHSDVRRPRRADASAPTPSRWSLQLDTRPRTDRLDALQGRCRPTARGRARRARRRRSRRRRRCGRARADPADRPDAVAVASLADKYQGSPTTSRPCIDRAVADQAGTRAGWEDIQTGQRHQRRRRRRGQGRHVRESPLPRRDRRSRLADAGVSLLIAVAGVGPGGAGRLADRARSITGPPGGSATWLRRLADGDLTVPAGCRRRTRSARWRSPGHGAGPACARCSPAWSPRPTPWRRRRRSCRRPRRRSRRRRRRPRRSPVSCPAPRRRSRRSVQTVAAGAEQMGASIREIASNAAEASEVAARAVDRRRDDHRHGGEAG